MPTACVQQPRAKIVLESERLIVTHLDEEGHTHRRDLPLRDLDRLILTETCSITSPAVAETLRRDIPITFLTQTGHFLGAFHPATPAHGATRIRHYQRSLDTDFQLTIARKITHAKAYNQRRLIQRVSANRRAAEHPMPPGIPATLHAIERIMERISHADSLDALRGQEGLAAARYFSAWASLLPPEFPFERRSTRPPLNPVNAVLSFTSTLIYHETHAFLHAHGLDAALGLSHSTENGRWSLALDLMEPFRPVLAEALTLDLFSHKMLKASHFEPHQGGTYLTRHGRAKLILQYEKRMERQFMSEAIGHRTTLRRRLEAQITQLKSALDDASSFEPFLMN